MPLWHIALVKGAQVAIKTIAKLRYAPAMQAEDLSLLVTRTMPFGKYQGRLIADLPGDYLNWFARTGFPKGEIGRLLALVTDRHIGSIP
jgi:hypothetical protein